MRWWIHAGLAVAALVSAGLAAAQDARTLRGAFETLDQDGDGKVTEEEFAENKIEVFFSGLQAFGRDHTLTYEETRITREAFEAADTNGDGKLAGAEWALAPFAQYTTYDPDGNGAITYEEFAAGVAPYLRGPAS